MLAIYELKPYWLTLLKASKIRVEKPKKILELIFCQILLYFLHLQPLKND